MIPQMSRQAMRPAFRAIQRRTLMGGHPTGPTYSEESLVSNLRFSLEEAEAHPPSLPAHCAFLVQEQEGVRYHPGLLPRPRPRRPPHHRMGLDLVRPLLSLHNHRILTGVTGTSPAASRTPLVERLTQITPPVSLA